MLIWLYSCDKGLGKYREAAGLLYLGAHQLEVGLVFGCCDAGGAFLVIVAELDADINLLYPTLGSRFLIQS
jgi:hypothetical protein